MGRTIPAVDQRHSLSGLTAFNRDGASSNLPIVGPQPLRGPSGIRMVAGKARLKCGEWSRDPIERQDRPVVSARNQPKRVVVLQIASLSAMWVTRLSLPLARNRPHRRHSDVERTMLRHGAGAGRRQVQSGEGGVMLGPCLTLALAIVRILGNAVLLCIICSP
jgi:hypothetical protein